MSIPKLVTTAAISLFGAAAALSCARAQTEQPMTPASSITARVTAKQTADTVVTERCNAAKRCGDIGAKGKYSSFEHCRNVLQQKIYDSFGSNTDCKNGVPQADFDKCRQEIQTEKCGGFTGAIDSVDRYMHCRPGHLCLD